MIKIRNVVFDYTKFYDFIELNLIHILFLLIKLIVEILDFFEMQLIFNKINKLKIIEKNYRIIEILNDLTKFHQSKKINLKRLKK